MLILISPAKTLDFKGKAITKDYTLPQFLPESEELVKLLKKKSARQIAQMMKINPKLAQLNYERFQEWHLPFSDKNAQESLLMFKGEVYNGLQAETFSGAELNYSQKVLRILSGLYGILRPLDLIQPYRLEMGVKWNTRKWKSLSKFWDQKITDNVKGEIEHTENPLLVNLASREYFDVINTSRLQCRMITPIFKEYHNGAYVFMTAYGKKARGLMARYIIQKQITNPDEMKLFDEDGYYFNDNLSEGDNWVFTRG